MVEEDDDNDGTASSASGGIGGGDSHANGAVETCSPVESNAKPQRQTLRDMQEMLCDASDASDRWQT